jgi:hypothetical protein
MAKIDPVCRRFFAIDFTIARHRKSRKSYGAMYEGVVESSMGSQVLLQLTQLLSLTPRLWLGGREVEGK